EDASVDHGTAEGTYAEMFTASLESAAFIEKDRDKLLAIALSYIPADCAVAHSVKTAMKARADGLDLKAARELVVKESASTGWFMAPQNVAFTVLGWLYGDGDFGKSICAAVNCGDDTDCTGATLGSLLGILGGSKSIPERWRAPVGEEIITVAIAGFDNPKTISLLTDKTLAMARRVLAEYDAPVALGARAETRGELALANPAAAKALWARSPWQLSAELICLKATLDLRAEPIPNAGTPWPVTVTLVNHTPHAQRVKLTWRLADGLTGPEPGTVELPASGKLDVTAELSVAPVAARELRGSLEIAPVGRTQVGVIPFGVGTKPAPRPGNLTVGGKATSDSEYDREPGCTALLIDGEITGPDDFEGHRWHAALKPHPHWAQIELAKSAAIGRVVVHSADPKGHPVSFVGEVSADGQAWKQVFEEADWQDAMVYDKTIAPVEARFFRLTIRKSSSTAYADAAQLSEIELLPPGK
ncbi:MAG: ADP-ribosylglycohydrolase family protein, partial [Armatimonadetes bacterium]|nr:ADP-ribosylglycohydrolase family protein [Armatimonadota bacterium]